MGVWKEPVEDESTAYRTAYEAKGSDEYCFQERKVGHFHHAKPDINNKNGYQYGKDAKPFVYNRLRDESSAGACPVLYLRCMGANKLEKRLVQYLTLVFGTGEKEGDNCQQHEDADKSGNYARNKMQPFAL